MQLTPDFPYSQWNGLSTNDLRPDLSHDLPPNFQDWDRIVAEVIGLQQYQNCGTATVDSSVSAGVVPGNIVSYKSSGKVALADKSGSGVAFRPFGMAITTSAKSTVMVYQYAGAVTLPTATWDAGVGTTGGLTAGDLYYLGATGQLTTTKSVTSGDSVVEIGVAASTTTLVLNIRFVATN